MSFFKSISDSVGTAAGVACPLFGIIAASFSLQIGGTLALILGSVSFFLFGTVGLAVFYILHQKNEADELKLNTKLTAYLNEFIEIFSYIYQQNNVDNINLIAALKKCPVQKAFIRFIKENYPSFLIEYPYKDQNKNFKIVKEIIQQFNSSQLLNKLIPSPPTSALASGFFINTVAVFGAVAGTSAGMMGIGVVLGLLGGFGIIPALGVGIIIFSALVAILIATHSTIEAIEKNHKTQLYKNFKQFNHSFQTNYLETNTSELSNSHSIIDNKTTKELEFSYLRKRTMSKATKVNNSADEDFFLSSSFKTQL